MSSSGGGRRKSSRLGRADELIEFAIETPDEHQTREEEELEDPRNDAEFGRFAFAKNATIKRKVYRESVGEEDEMARESGKFLEAGAPLVGDTFFEVDDLNERFRSGDDRVVQEMRPPYAPRISQADQRQVLDWERQRLARLQQIRSSPGYKFAMIVASETNSQIDQLYREDDDDLGRPLDIGPSYVGADVGESLMQASGARVRVMQDDNVVVVEDDDDDADRTTTEGEAPGEGLAEIERRASILSKIESVRDAETREQLQRAFDDRIKRERLLTRRSAMRNERRYIEQPQNLGIMYFTAMLFGQTQSALGLVPRFAPQLASATLESYIRGEKARQAFGTLVGNLINTKRAEAPTRWYPRDHLPMLHRNRQMLLKLFSDRFKYDAVRDLVYESDTELASARKRKQPERDYPDIAWT